MVAPVQVQICASLRLRRPGKAGHSRADKPGDRSPTLPFADPVTRLLTVPDAIDLRGQEGADSESAPSLHKHTARRVGYGDKRCVE